MPVSWPARSGAGLLQSLDGVVLGEFRVVIATTYGSVIEVGTTTSR